MKILQRWVLIILLAVLAVGAAAPFLSADRFRPRIQAALETALNRPVEIGAVHLNLFTGPGFTLERVVIGDEPAAGVEPFAYVESLRARVRLLSLLAGKLAFSSLHLDAPSVNLVRMPSGAWNVQPWLDRPPAAKSVAHTFPDIQISGGRLNFKFGDTKSLFYISAADVDVYPNERGDLVIRFSGIPARTDRASQTFGEISARGLLHSGAGAQRLNMGVHLERTAISEIVQLFDARDLGVHGFTLAEAQLTGPLDKIDVTGSLNINDIHRWDLMPPHGEGWTMHYRGVLDLHAHHLDLTTFSSEGQPQPVSIQLAIADYLANARWSAGIRFHDLPASSLLETARHMGAPLAQGVQVDGKINGDIGYSNQNGLAGELVLESASVKFPQSASAAFDSARLTFTNNNLTLHPISIQLDNDQSAEIQGQYAFDNTHTSFKITTPQLTIAEVEGGADRLVQGGPIPLLEHLRQGTWKGWIAFERKDDGPGIWSGEYDLQNGLMEIPGLASPVRLLTASVAMKQNQVQISRMRGRVDSVRLDGDYRYDPDAAQPDRLRLHIPELNLDELERLMLPTLSRNESFLSRTFRRNPPLPKWLENRSLDASIQIGSILKGETRLGQFESHLKWLGPKITLSDAELRLDPMRATGGVTINVAKASPAYQLTGSIENLAYRDGQLDVDGELEASGTGASLLVNVQSEGTFEGRQIALAPDAQVDSISGAYRLASSLGIPRLVLSNLQVAVGQDNLVGQGASQSDGRLVLELMSGRKPVRLTGMLLPLR